MNYLFLILLIVICLISCKSPKLVLATKENTENNNCEVGFITEKKYTDIKSFETEFKRKIIQEANRCGCDTLFIDLDDIFTMKDPYSIWGVCKSEKWSKKLN